MRLMRWLIILASLIAVMEIALLYIMSKSMFHEGPIIKSFSFVDPENMGRYQEGDSFTRKYLRKKSINLELDHWVWTPKSVSKLGKIKNITMVDFYDGLDLDKPFEGTWVPERKDSGNSYKQKTKLKIFVVLHSHNDPGWIYTFDKYYKRNSKKIITNIVTELLKDKSRRFIWAEVSFLAKWYDEAAKDMQDALLTLLKSGQLEIVNGGWVMPDEATTHWYSLLMQLTVGSQWLQQNLGHVYPRYTWSIDPFGHSASVALLYKKCGFKGHVINRVHYAVKKHFGEHQMLDFWWRQLWDSKDGADFRTHLFPYKGYNFQYSCGLKPSECGTLASFAADDFNLEKRLPHIIQQLMQKSQLFKTNSILLPLGGDFSYGSLLELKKTMKICETIFGYLKLNPQLNIEAKWSTLSEYFRSVEDGLVASKQNLPIVKGDFFPYADDINTYWSGFYTTRPFYKRMERILANLLRSAEILHFWQFSINIKNTQLMMKELDYAREILALFQHHDAITGTSRYDVMADFEEKMVNAFHSLHLVIKTAFETLLQFSKEDPDLIFDMDDPRLLKGTKYFLDNRPVIDFEKSNNFTIIIHNSMLRSRTEVVTFQIRTAYVQVTDYNKNPVVLQIAPAWHRSFSQINALKNCYEVSFKASLKSGEIGGYIIAPIDKEDNAVKYIYFSSLKLLGWKYKPQELEVYPGSIAVSNVSEESLLRGFNNDNKDGVAVAAFDKCGLLKFVQLENNNTILASIDFMVYETVSNKSHPGGGAYIFQPSNEAKSIPENCLFNKNNLVIEEGPLFSKLTSLLKHVKHEITLQNGVLNIQNLLRLEEKEDIEFVMKIKTGIDSGNEFFTDSNGLQIIQRKTRPNLHIAGNYYPVTTAMYIEDKKNRMTLLTGQPLGGASLKSGHVEMMQDRFLNKDDKRGLGEEITDNIPTQNVFKLIFESRYQSEDSSTKIHYRPYGHLSSKANSEMQFLFSPIERMFTSSAIDYMNVVMTRTDFPEDIVIPRLAVVPQGNHLQAGIVLHETVLDSCFSKVVPTEHVNLDKHLNLRSNNETFNIVKAHLTFKDTMGQQHSIDNEIKLLPMDVKAFILIFE